MAITDVIAANLSAWMDGNPSLDTIKKVSSRSGVGFGTVRRVKNGDGNPTITNLADIARVFGRSAIELIAAPDGGVTTAVAALGGMPSRHVRTDTLAERIDRLAPRLTEADWAMLTRVVDGLEALHPKKRNK